jgi:hypothetical protein
MRLIVRLLLSLLLILGLARMVIFLLYAAAMLPTPLEAHNLEAKMVLLAWRAQQGLSLYPPWWDYPHVSNFYGPIDFVVVGLLGRLLRADIPGLFLIGRAVTFGSSLMTSLVLAAWIGRRYGRLAGLAGGVLSLGAGPMYGFTIMVRSDSLAELFGVAGFFLSGRESRAGRIAGVALLILAALTKQTAGIFLGAAALSLALSGDWRRALGVLGGGLAVLILLVLAINALFEPYFVVSLLGDGRTPWDFPLWHSILYRVVTTSPDLLVLPLVGLWLWVGSRPRDLRSAALAVVILTSSLVLSGKVGADMNYYLSLRVVEAIAAGALWHAADAPAGKSRGRSAALVTATALATISLVPSFSPATAQLDHARRRKEFFAGPHGYLVLSSYRIAFSRAQDADFRLLTDSGLVDLYQGERAAFGDPYLFHLLAETGRIEISKMERWVDSQFYDLIVTTHAIESPGYVSQDFRLPMALVERARARYVLRGVRPGLFFYGRAGVGGSSPPGASRAGATSAPPRPTAAHEQSR